MNDNYGKILKKQWSTAEFKVLLAEIHGEVGTHSIQKFASTWAACVDTFLGNLEHTQREVNSFISVT
jgi:hypothetical protein